MKSTDKIQDALREWAKEDLFFGTADLDMVDGADRIEELEKENLTLKREIADLKMLILRKLHKIDHDIIVE